MKNTKIYMSLLALIFAASSCTKGCKAEQKVEEPVAEEAPADKEAEEIPAKEEAPAQPEAHEAHEGHEHKDPKAEE